MKIAVIHSSLNQFGGAERLCVTMIKTLQKAGNKVTLVTLDKTNWLFLEKKYGLTCILDREVFLIPNTFETASTTQRVALTSAFFFVMFPLLTLKDKHDLVINTSGEIIDLMEDIAYINAVPMRAAFDYPEVLPVKSSLWRCFSRVYDLFLKVVDEFNNDSFLLTNSKFNEAAIRKYYGRHALVIYPPVDVERFEQDSGNKRRKNIVITVSRFRPGKNLEYIPRVAKLASNSRFLVIGPSDKTSRMTISGINGAASRLGVRERIELVTNAPLAVLHRMLSEAKIFLQTQLSEAFGISIVEAMAAGCVPVVPRDGGPWFDILERKEGIYGFSYGSISEAAEKIEMLMQNDELRTEVSARARRRAMDFNSSVFEKRISSIVRNVYLNKLSHHQPR